ncbi:hypothetical protein CF326_g1836 [Tilletia indica]|nr:hypothetical protein CF326_g1836 [Tilletia indica]
MFKPNQILTHHRPSDSSTPIANTTTPLPTQSVPSETASATPTRTRPGATNSTAAPNLTTSYITSQGPSGLVVTSVIFETGTANPNGVLNGADSSGSRQGFFNNPGAVGGTFAAVGLLILLVLASAFCILRRKRRARKLAEDVNIAVSAAASHKRTPFEDDDDDEMDVNGMERMRQTPSQHMGDGGGMMNSNSSSQLHGGYAGQGNEYSRHSPMNSMGSMGGMGIAMTAAAAGQGQHQTYYDGRPGSSGMDGGANGYNTQGYYSQSAQSPTQAQQQAYAQHSMGNNPYADAGMSGNYYHQLTVDQPLTADDPNRRDSRGIANYFQPGYGQVPNYSTDSPAEPQSQQQRGDGPPRLDDPFSNPRLSGGGGARSPLGADTILDGEGMPFANRRTSGRRSNGSAPPPGFLSGSGEADGASGNGGGSGFLALPMGIDGEGSLLAYNRFSSSTNGASGGTGASSTVNEEGSPLRGGGSDGRKSVRTSDGAMFTMAPLGER